MPDKVTAILITLIFVSLAILVLIKTRQRRYENFKVKDGDNLPSKALLAMMNTTKQTNDNLKNDIIAAAQFEVDESKEVYETAKKNFENSRDALSRAGYELKLRKDNLNYIKEQFFEKALEDSKNQPEFIGSRTEVVKWEVTEDAGDIA
jgi:hypothetical protein